QVAEDRSEPHVVFPEALPLNLQRLGEKLFGLRELALRPIKVGEIIQGPRVSWIFRSQGFAENLDRLDLQGLGGFGLSHVLMASREIVQTHGQTNVFLPGAILAPN